MKIASIQLSAKILITTSGMMPNTSPRKPGRNSSGMKATMLDRIENASGTAISRAPRMAASRMLAPRSRCEWMFSPTMMASSTTMPSAMMKANIEIMLMDTPTSGRNSIAPRKAVGMPSVTQKARRASRNSPSSTSTSTSPIQAFLSSSSRRS